MKRQISILLILIILLTGCNTSYKSLDTEGLIEYKSVYSGEISTLNYLKTSNTGEFGVLANLIDPLIDYDKYGRIQPAIAETWKVSEDKLVWNFKLREGVDWLRSDGSKYGELTAYDFVDSMKYILDSSNNSLTANIIYGAIENAQKYYNKEITDFSKVGVKAKSKYELEYTLKKPLPYFLSMLTYVCFFPVNGAFLNEVGDKFGIDNKNILYNGAFLMEDFQPQIRRVLIKNRDYWDKKNVHIDRLLFTYNKEATNLSAELFLRGEIDSTNISPIILDDWIKDEEKKDLIRPNRNNYYSFFYCFNFNPLFKEEYDPKNWKKAVNNRNFRKAIFHALDKRAAMINSEPYNPEKRIQNTITPEGFIDFRGKDYTDFNDLKDIKSTDTFNPNLALKYKEKAIKELRGEVEFPVKVLMPYNTSLYEWGNRAQVIQQQIGKLLGNDFIDIIIDPKPPIGFIQDVRRTGQYALLECNWGADYRDPQTYTDPFISSGTYNYPHLAKGYTERNGKTKYENMINKAEEELIDIEKRLKLFSNAESFLIDEAFVIPYAVGGGGYSASRLNPFESSYSPFGISSQKYKYRKIMERPMNSDDFYRELELWKKERKQILKENN